MVKRVTIKDVAREAGVSIALVSFVMNRNNRRADGKEAYRVSEETVARILEIAARLDYHPNSAASSLRSGKTRTIGVVVSDIANRFFSDIVRYIENVAYESGYTVLFASTDEKADKLERMVSVLTNKGVDGLIIASCAGANRPFAGWSRRECPWCCSTATSRASRLRGCCSTMPERAAWASDGFMTTATAA